MSAQLSAALIARSSVAPGNTNGTGAVDRVDRLLLLEEVKSVVMKAAAAGHTLRIGPHAKRLFESGQAAGFSQGRIADELIIAAAQAGVPVEIDRTE